MRHFSGGYRCLTYAARGYPPSDVPRDPAAYSQERAVADGELPDRVPNVDDLRFAADPQDHTLARGHRAVQADEHDPRITRVGRLLRATSLDELPQLLNIWRGEMSWVGPRALPINERQLNETGTVSDDAIPGFGLRCAVRPGLTGIAQIYAPRDVARYQKFRTDFETSSPPDPCRGCGRLWSI